MVINWLPFSPTAYFYLFATEVSLHILTHPSLLIITSAVPCLPGKEGVELEAMGPRHSERTHAIPTWSLISHGLGGVCKAVQNQALPSHPKLGIGTTHWAPGTLGLHCSLDLGVVGLGQPALPLQLLPPDPALLLCPSPPFCTRPTPWPDVCGVTGGGPRLLLGRTFSPQGWSAPGSWETGGPQDKEQPRQVPRGKGVHPGRNAEMAGSAAVPTLRTPSGWEFPIRGDSPAPGPQRSGPPRT